MTEALTMQQFASLWSDYLFHAFWQAGLVAIIIIAFVKIGKCLPSNVRYGVLLVALLKFTIPFMPALSVGVFNAMQTAGKEIPALSSISDIGSRTAQGYWPILLLAIYVLGLLVAAVRLSRQQRRLKMIRRAGTKMRSGELYENFVELTRAMKFRRPPLLITSAAATVPFVFGLRTQIVFLPSAAIERLSADELRPVLAHELAHLRHRDQWVSWLQALLGVVWWFNPFYHLLSKVIREVREECRDDAVLAAGVASSHSYSCSMLAVAALARPQPQSHIALHSLDHNLHPLAIRLARIADSSITRREQLTASQWCFLILGALIILPGLTLSSHTTIGKENGTMASKNSRFEFSHSHERDSHQDHQESHRRAHNH